MWLNIIVVCTIIDIVYSVNKKKASKIGNLFFEMAQETKSLSRKSHYSCFSECLRRKSCICITSSYRKDLEIRGNAYMCHLYVEGATLPEHLNVTCPLQIRLVAVLPQAIIGACADHRCESDQVCHPLKGRGYECKRDRGRKKGGRSRRRKKKDKKKKKKKYSFGN